MIQNIDMIVVMNNFSPTDWFLFWLLTLILVETVYFTLIRTNKRLKEQSHISHTIENKLLSLIMTFSSYYAIAFILQGLTYLILIVGVGGLVALYFYLNYLANKVFGKEESLSEREERLDREDEKHDYKFRVGDKVKIVSIYKFNEDGQKDMKIGSIHKISRRFRHDERNTYEIEGCDAKWIEKRFKKVKG